MNEHHYAVSVEWQGNRGTGTSGYRDYGRQGVIRAEGKVELPASADRTFHGDRDRWNPEELLVAALAECHMLSYLHVAVQHGVVVTAYEDAAVGTMAQAGQGGHFTSVTLRPVVTLDDPSQVELANSLHHEASAVCFIAQSVNFPVLHEPTAR
ncbi:MULTISPECIES: OsmC family protein [Subtercola]|uniref:OsmC family peroxiredoxin n=1 Tax=Subtercola vilae TaxID=2056433 RepID=A0A4T2BGW9_9MICO|nr:MULTISPECIES: OsmC family protein [Subtercola]MEA9985171.1 OsmC family protein [Subtercola sp. RTI3]TIH30110.1 OsmC family peroxiredoxin [Subtercola vilae]